MAKETQRVSTVQLQLDYDNPRLGHSFDKNNASENDLLDSIVDQHGVDDLLGSISVNGFFDAEPLVGIKDEGSDRIIIIEGNRRLAACLILLEDPRAANHAQRTSYFKKLSTPKIIESINDLPVIIHDSRESLLSYLGIRHIAGAKGWDSYAKAAWLYDVVFKN